MEERLGYCLDEPGLKVSAGTKDVSLLHNVQTTSEAQLATYSGVTGVLVQEQCGLGMKLKN
jgi:hypothetical protein